MPFNYQIISSKTTTLEIVDQVVDKHDEKILLMRDKVENMWQNHQTKRERRTAACSDVPGLSFFGDNVG